MRLDRRQVRILVDRAVYEVGTVVATYPSVALPIARWRRHGEPVRRDTEVVIEGYPRSANTFAVASFAAGQRHPVRIAHHVHAPAQVIEGARRGLPTLVLIRPPGQAVIEFVLLKPTLGVAQALRGWVRFYEPLLRHRGRFVVATTEEVLSDFGEAVRRLNRRFGTAFQAIEHTEETRDRIQRVMAAHWEGRRGPGLPFVGRSGQPEENGDADRERLGREYASPVLHRLRRRAESLHATFLELAR